jgi:hypothetical protein
MDCVKQSFIQGLASKSWIRLLIFSVGLFGITQLRAATGSDNAANYSSWSSGGNEGTGFGPWVLESNNDGTTKYAGNYLATSSNPAGRYSGIFSPDSTGNAFALYANPVGAFVTAKRNFGESPSPTPLAVGQSFRVQWLQFWGGGNKGINLYRGGWDDTADKVLNLRQDGDKFLAQSRGSLNSPTAIADAYNNLTTVTVRRAAPDTLILNIQTEDPLDIPYSSTFRSPAPDRVSFYFSNGANGADASNDEPLFNNLSIEADSTPVETRQIKFSVNMVSLAAQSPKGFDAAQGDKIYVRGYPSGGWGETEKVELIQEVEGIYSVVLNVAGDTGLKSGGYKFYIEKGASSTTVVVNSGYESSDEREFNLPVSNVDLPVVYFNNVSTSRTITFAANMGVQISKSLFTPATHGVEVRGSFTSPIWTGGLATLADPDNDGIYTGSFTVPGNLGGAVEYKFYRTGTSGAGYEGLADNRTLTLGADGVNSTIATAFFNNDDGVGPVISIIGDNPLNLNVADTYTELGATATDLIDGNRTVTPSGTVNTAVANTYTITYNASDVAGNAGTPVTRTVVVAAPVGSTFAGAYPGVSMTDVAPNGLTYLANYAFGGNETTQAMLPVQDTSDPTKLRLVVIFRTDDDSLTLGGQASTGLETAWSSAEVTVVDGDSTGLPANMARKVISVDRGSDLKKFLRATVTK